MSSKKRFSVMLIFWLSAPFMVNAYAYLPAQAPSMIPRQIDLRLDPTLAMTRPHVGVPGLDPGEFSNEPTAKPPAAVKHSSKWKQMVGLRRQLKQLKKNMPEEMAGYERSALIWGSAALFAAIFFVLLGVLLESALILAALLAIPFAIISLVNHRKAKKMGSSKVAGAVMAISGLAIIGTLFFALIILLLAYA